MPYISVSNVRVEEVRILSDLGDFAVVEILSKGSRIMLRKSRLYDDRKELEEKLGIKKVFRSPYDYPH